MKLVTTEPSLEERKNELFKRVQTPDNKLLFEKIKKAIDLNRRPTITVKTTTSYSGTDNAVASPNC